VGGVGGGGGGGGGGGAGGELALVGQKGKQHLGQSREDREYRKAQNQAAKKLQFTKKDKTELLRAIMSHGLLRSKVGARFATLDPKP